MAAIKKARGWLMRPLLLGAICSAVGAGAGMLVVGMPQLWTAEAAGWASAIGTMAAVLVALHLGRQQTTKDEKNRRSRAKWVALELRRVLGNWGRAVSSTRQQEHADLYFLLNDDRYRNPVEIPPDLTALQAQLHELGDDAAPIADAMWVARQLSLMPIEDALKGNLGEEEDFIVVRRYYAGLASLEKYIEEAQKNVSAITGLSATDPAGKTFDD